MPDGVIGQRMLLAPGRGIAVQLRRPAGCFAAAEGAAAGEQAMTTPPAAHLVERHQEQSRPLCLLEQHLAALAASDRITKPAAQPLQH